MEMWIKVVMSERGLCSSVLMKVGVCVCMPDCVLVGGWFVCLSPCVPLPRRFLSLQTPAEENLNF